MSRAPLTAESLALEAFNAAAPRLLENAAAHDQLNAHSEHYQHAEARMQRDLFYYTLGREGKTPPAWRPMVDHLREYENSPIYTLRRLLERKVHGEGKGKGKGAVSVTHPLIPLFSLDCHGLIARILPADVPPAAAHRGFLSFAAYAHARAATAATDTADTATPKRKRAASKQGAHKRPRHMEVHPEVRLQTPKIKQLARLVSPARYPWTTHGTAFTTEAKRAKTPHVEAFVQHTFDFAD